MNIGFKGEIFSLLAALTWAFAVICFKKSGEFLSPLRLNIFKTLLALLFFFPTMLLTGTNFFPNVTFDNYLLLLLSGFIGIGVSDTLFFKSLNLLGAGLSAIVDCLYSPFIIFFSIIFLEESLTFKQIVGTLLILSAVFSVYLEKKEGNIEKKSLVSGIIYGCLAMFTVAIGIVIIKPILNKSSVIWATQIRLLGGFAGLLLFSILSREKKVLKEIFSGVNNLRFAVGGAFFGTYLSMLFWIGGMKYTNASLSAILNQTSNIFVFLASALFLKEPINKIRFIAIILAITGAIIVVYN